MTTPNSFVVVFETFGVLLFLRRILSWFLTDSNFSANDSQTLNTVLLCVARHMAAA